MILLPNHSIEKLKFWSGLLILFHGCTYKYIYATLLLLLGCIKWIAYPHIWNRSFLYLTNIGSSCQFTNTIYFSLSKPIPLKMMLPDQPDLQLCFSRQLSNMAPRRSLALVIDTSGLWQIRAEVKYAFVTHQENAPRRPRACLRAPSEMRFIAWR